MAVGDKRFTRIPPESTGDRVYMIHTAEIPFTSGGINVGHTWVIGGMYMIADFGMVHVHGVYDKEDGTGLLSVHYNKDDKFEGNVPASGKNITYDGSTVGVTGTAYDVYVPAQNIMGYDNPEYGLDVDAYGSAQVTFDEGAPQLDAFGKLRVSGATHLGEYVYASEDELNENYSLTYLNKGARSVRTAEVAYSNAGKYIEPRVKSQQDFAAATSNTYHHYIPGSSHLFMGTALFSGGVPLSTANGSRVNSGTERNFGIFDADNGFMFRVGPTGHLYLVRRTKIGGTVKNYVLASSDTSDGFDNFNGDRVNGSRTTQNRSQLDLDLSKDNIYWIDVQWHGAGRIRFGTYNNGQRLVIHEYYHSNRYSEPMSATASLPVCQSIYYYSDSEMQNHAVYGDGSGTEGNFAGLPGDLVRIGLTASRTADANFVYTRSWSGSVWTESDLNLQSLGRPHVYTSGHLAVDGSGFRPLFTLSPREMLASGDVDHTLFIPTKISAYAYDNAVTSPAGTNRESIVHFRVGRNCVHSGHDFSDISGTNFQISTAGVSFEDTNKPGVCKKIEFEDMFNGQYTDVLTDRYINLQNGSYKNAPDDGGVAEHVVSDVENPIETTGVGAAVDGAGNSTTLLLDSQAETSTLTSEVTQYSTTIDVADASSFVVGGTISADDAQGTPYFSDGTIVLAINSNTITLNKPTQNQTIPTSTVINHVKLIEGASITGTNIPANTVIRSVDSATQVTLSQATTGTFAGSETFTMTRPGVVTIDPSDADNKPSTGDRWLLAEPQAATFPLNSNDGALHLHGVTATGTNPFPTTLYIKIISLTQAYLYTDRELTQPLTIASNFSYTSGGVIHGFRGSRSTFTFFAHEQIKNFQDPRVMFSIQWKEIIQ